MAMRPYEFETGRWFTVTLTRDGEADTLHAEVDGVKQDWEILYPPWDTPKDFVPTPVDHASDLLDEAVQNVTSFPLRIVQDDRVTEGETGRGRKRTQSFHSNLLCSHLVVGTTGWLQKATVAPLNLADEAVYLKLRLPQPWPRSLVWLQARSKAVLRLCYRTRFFEVNGEFWFHI